MIKKRGLYYSKYLGVNLCSICGERGYYEEWKNYLSEHYSVLSVRHARKGKTTRRCWLSNAVGVKK